MAMSYDRLEQLLASVGTLGWRGEQARHSASCSCARPPQARVCFETQNSWDAERSISMSETPPS